MALYTAAHDRALRRIVVGLPLCAAVVYHQVKNCERQYAEPSGPRCEGVTEWSGTERFGMMRVQQAACCGAHHYPVPTRSLALG